jgi:two-component system, cell cycle sensor histidine kinase PleC
MILSQDEGTVRPGDDRAFTAARLARQGRSVAPEATCADVLEFFLNQGHVAGAAVVDGDRVLGLVDRARLTAVFARPLMAELYAARPVTLLMDATPLIVEADRSLAEVTRLITEEKPSALVTGFVVTRQDRYLGMGMGLDLMALTARQAELRAHQLEEAWRAAEEASHAKTAFLANASHEIRTPLNAIMGFAELLHQEVLGPLGNSIYRQYAGDIVDSGRHLTDLINDLLDLSKAEADRLEIVEGMVDVPRLAASCIRLVSERAMRAGITLDAAIPRDAPVLRADERKVRQMLLNLLSNAVKYTPPGGRIVVTGEAHGDGGYRLAVVDSGVGMTPAELARALEPWARIDSALNRKLIGTGLGLPLTKRLIELHGGRMLTESTPGVGTAMTLVFPPGRIAPSAQDCLPLAWSAPD